MNKTWRKILKIKTLKSDKEKLGLFPIKRIQQSFALKDESELPTIKRFIKDEIRLLERGTAHYSKWSPLVYHRNVHISRKIEKRTFEIILKRLEKM